MCKRISSMILACVLLSYAQDYVFPSPMNPAGKDPAGITQLISIIWDDNAYSGLDGTAYEHTDGDIPWEDASVVGGQGSYATHGFPSWIPQNNALNIQEGDMGMKWAIDLGVPQTFTMITGLYVDVWSDGNHGQGEAWMNYQSEYGWYEPRSEDGLDHNTIAVSWGREHEVWVRGNPEELVQPNTIKIATQQALDAGHEIADHTFDHMESNSPLPYQEGNNPYGEGDIQGMSNTGGFSSWGGEGFNANNTQVTPWGDTITQSEQFGQPVGSRQQHMGWAVYAGRFVSEDAWKGALEYSREAYADAGFDLNTFIGFRAPRLETSSGLFYALADLGYLWDCSLEEGYENHRDGTNMLWPYTVDNGAQNTWTQYSRGGRRHIDSMPAGEGLWQIPVNTFIVPEHIRDDVYDNYEIVLEASGGGNDDDILPAAEGFDNSSIGTQYQTRGSDRQYWLQHGKITGFDFNTWILWGMTHDNWVEMMKHTLDLRMEGNRAPLSIGMHTDYHTPIYDNATLLTDFNRDAWGLCVVNGWNTWEDRISALEKFITYAQSQPNTEFVTATEQINRVRDLANKAPEPLQAQSGDDITFAFIRNEELNSSASQGAFSGSFDGKVVVDAVQGSNYPWATFSAYNLDVDDLSHISLDYKSTSPLAIIIELESGEKRQALLNNIYPKENIASSPMVQSGKIPLHAFDYEETYTGELTYDPIDPTEITAIEIKPLAPMNRHDGSWGPRLDPYEVSFMVENITFYGSVSQGETSIIDDMTMSPEYQFSVEGVVNNQLSLVIPEAGQYSLRLTTPMGRQVASFDGKSLSQGVNQLSLPTISRGVYLLQIENARGGDLQQQKLYIR
ncbi:polysaccharide deacetylase [Chitinivibrio alkaliphilus]|uniref:Polysaccharide deacetylase n=1 Tax=Chitinivibrio alkaliphilus ACht1 TaxID=1313304 RepID=U7D6I4_9BACT|nr:polysaccharide deacetylase [Chitinivibrio alkaliphilus]ERP31181.1 polysaccharide deacetylase [Chitinivibrio alkaliphilus ACht1]